MNTHAETTAQTRNYARYEIEFVRGEGSYLFDADGERYLDLLCGIGVNSVGHCHPQVVDAVERQARALMHTSNLFWTEPAELLARRLVELSFPARVFFCNSGAEANEAAIKLARAAAYGDGRPGREVVVLERAFHGRTMGALSATPQEDKQAPFAPLVQGFRTAPRDDADALARAVTDQTCAVLIEPVQGESGVYPVPDDVLVAAREACDAVGALLVFDEVQCGIGRTGSFFAYEQTPVVPDVITLAKALGGGLPIGAMIAADHVAPALAPGYHGSTFGGNLVSCAAANAVLDIVTADGFLREVRRRGEAFSQLLSAFGTVEGRGLMVGLQLAATVGAKAVVERLLFDHRVIANFTGPHTLRFLPPLIAGDKDFAGLPDALESAIASATR